MNKHRKMKQNKAAVLPISNLSTRFNHSLSMDSKGQLNPATKGSHFFDVIVDHFGIYVVTVPTSKKNGPYCLNSTSTTGYQNLVLLKI